MRRASIVLVMGVVLRVGGEALAGCCSQALAAPQVEVGVVNRFRLLAGEAEQQRYYADLEQRLICGAYANRSLRNSKTCNPLKRSDRLGMNYGTHWSRSNFAFVPTLVHDLWRELRLNVTGLAKAKSAAKNARCRWTVNGEDLAAHSCTDVAHRVKLGGDRSADLKVRVTIDQGDSPISIPEQNFPIRDVVIATIGDSFLSGEGNPHLALRLRVGNPDSPLFGRRSEWLDVRCHRSLFTGAVIAAERLARRVSTQSVTMLPLACSGAEVREGMLGPFLGRETNNQAMWVPPDDSFGGLSNNDVFQARLLPTQFDVLRRALCPDNTADASCDDRRIRPDLIILSTGGNEIGFGDIIRTASSGGPFPSTSVADKLAGLPAQYEEVHKALIAVKPRAVAAIAYLDPTQQYKIINGRRQLDYCDDITARPDRDTTFVPRFATLLGYGITAKNARKAQQEVVQPLNQRFSDAAQKYDWRFLTLPAEVQRGHGFCSTKEAWFYSYTDSLKFQGLIAIDNDDLHGGTRIGNVPSGAMHPNIFGHYNIAERIYAEFKALGLRP